MSTALVDTATIPGWVVDADPENDPTFPMRHQENQTRGLTWTRPAQQHPQVEVLRSIEHNQLPAVVGTSTPPAGLSGMIRRVAFRRSESDWFHWLMLMGADRLGVVEGVVSDLSKGKVPNVPAEMGWRAEWEHNRSGFVRKIGTTLAVSAVSIALLRAWRAAGGSGDDAADHAVPAVSPAQPADAPVTNEPIAPIVALPEGS